ncbi:hypothetical protein RJ639_028138 [Escallonia herrerae]|uniref:Uncharacterized protein n=1 Tax=Escallonia herrerae TaxID=1293975 RepID=A0AA89BCX9_9ASTE|nr:hypothetical protein RJ639_028138 [Escallonia herrerae]
MASLATHFTASLLLLPLGARRLLSSSSLYLHNPSHYRSKPWYLLHPKWKNLDFYTLLIALPILSFSHLFLFLASPGHPPTPRFAFLQQSAVVFLFWVLLILTLCSQNLDPNAGIPDTLLFVFAGIAFLIDYLMNGKGVVGLGGIVYGLLGGVTVVCAACCFYLSIRPSAFFAEFMLSLAILLKGSWVLQVGLSLYTDAFAFEGCGKISRAMTMGQVDVRCDLEEDRLRGVALMNLVFIGHAAAVLTLSFVLFGLLCRYRSMRCGEASGPLLAGLESENMLMHPIPEFEID